MKFRLLVFVALLSLTYTCSKTAQQGSPYTGPIIDMHIHAYSGQNPMFGMTHPPTLRGKTYVGASSAAEQKELTLAKFSEHNIVKAMVSDGLSWYEDFPEQIMVGGADEPIDVLREQFQKGRLQVIGELSPFYAGVLADDSANAPYFALAEELDIPVGFHVFPGGPNSGIHLMPQMLGGMRAYNANPMQLEDVLVRYPDLKLYIMHGGWPYVEDVKALMYAHPNLYVDISVVNWVLPLEELDSYLKALIDSGFGDRIMYGSDQMVWPEVISVGIESINQAPSLTPSQREDIFYNNAARFLGLSAEEIKSHKR